jgi:hypothetical protein
VRIPSLPLLLALLAAASTTASRPWAPDPRLLPQVLFSDAARATLHDAWVSDSGDAYQPERAWCGSWRLEDVPGAGPHPRVYLAVPAVVTGATTSGLATVSCPRASDRGPGGSKRDRQAASTSPDKTAFSRVAPSAVLAHRVTVDGDEETRPVIIHTHPPFSCRATLTIDRTTGLVASGREVCARGGDLAYLCAPSFTDQLSLVASARAFGVVYCDEHALVPFWNPNAEVVP